MHVQILYIKYIMCAEVQDNFIPGDPPAALRTVGIQSTA